MRRDYFTCVFLGLIAGALMFVCFAPFENPEIAIACFIPNGYSGSEASKAPKAFIDWYMNQKILRSVEDSLPPGNSLAP